VNICYVKLEETKSVILEMGTITKPCTNEGSEKSDCVACGFLSLKSNWKPENAKKKFRLSFSTPKVERRRGLPSL
jgi:hypothetical protein